MKVKLLKRIRERFCVVPIYDEEWPDFIHKWIVFDNKTAIEHSIYGDSITQSIAQICFCLDTYFFKYSSWYERKIEKRSTNALRRKYFPFRKN